MVLSLIKNIIPKRSNVEKNNSVDIKPQENHKKDITPQHGSYKGAMYGAMFGVGAGIGDGIATSFCNKRDFKKSMEEFKNYSFADKKLAIKNLHEQGVSVKEYKQFMAKNLNMPKTILKRGILYGGIIGATGLAIDLYKNHKIAAINTEKKA